MLFFSGNGDARDVLVVLDNRWCFQQICRNDKFVDDVGVLISELYAEHSARFQERRNTCNQRFYYLVCEDPRIAHDDVMREIATKANMEPFLHKLIIPADKKLEFLSNLRLMNITGASLFPGADGLGIHVAEMSKLIAHKFRNMPPYDDPVNPQNKGHLN